MASFKKPSAILLDIEGTISEIEWVSKTLFPFIKENVANYLNDAYCRSECQELIRRLRVTQDSATNLDLPRIASSNESKETIIRTVNEFALAGMRLKNHSAEMKQLQLLVWAWGYERGRLKGHVYDEVSNRMHVWKHQEDIPLYTFSSGVILAQKLSLCCTNLGNLLPLISDYFDSTMGEKTETPSYVNIAAKIEQPTGRILFLTDCPKEAKAAREAGYLVAIIKRPHSKQLKGVDLNELSIPVIKSFDDVRFK